MFDRVLKLLRRFHEGIFSEDHVIAKVSDSHGNYSVFHFVAVHRARAQRKPRDKEESRTAAKGIYSRRHHSPFLAFFPPRVIAYGGYEVRWIGWDDATPFARARASWLVLDSFPFSTCDCFPALARDLSSVAGNVAFDAVLYFETCRRVV